MLGTKNRATERFSTVYTPTVVVRTGLGIAGTTIDYLHQEAAAGAAD